MSAAAPKGSARVSIITAAFGVPELLERAILSLLAQSDPNWEMLISPDDGANYLHLERRDPRLRVIRSNAVATGPGAARNRALEQARGDYIAVLDDDDTLAPNFIAAARASLAEREAVIAPTLYVDAQGQAIREIGAHCASIDIGQFSTMLGSMHVIGRRATYPNWEHCFAEDVVHTCRAIAAAGGRLDVLSATRYRNHVREGSSCTSRRDIDSEYALLEQDSYRSMSAIYGMQTRALFAFRRAINARFEARTDRSIAYHDFIQIA